MLITNASQIIEGNIKNSINACRLDLQLAGVYMAKEDDALMVQAAIFYTKADMNYNNKGERFRQAYEALKISMALSGDYAKNHEGGG